MFDLNRALLASVNPSICNPSNRGYCARAVRTILEAGGINTAGRPTIAREYVMYLPKIGWQLIGSLGTAAGQSEFTRNQAKPGDIAVYTKPGLPSAPGHICFWNGRNWCSDFPQNNMNVYSSPVNAYIFRYTGEIKEGPGLPSGFFVPSQNPMTFMGTLSAQIEDSKGQQDIEWDKIDGQELADECPRDIKMKGLWSLYQLRLGKRSEALKVLSERSKHNNENSMNFY